VNNDKNEHAHFVTIGLFSDAFKGEPKVMEPDEIVEWQWFSLDNLPTPLFFPSAKIIENYRKKLFYMPQ
jgi:8-oxo-dGTP diphosphatase